MTLADPIPYGLREVKFKPFTTGETVSSTPIKLPASRTFSFTEAEDFEELRGDDGVITVRGKGGKIEWKLEGGGVSLAVMQAMYGGTITTSGTTPAQIATFRKLATDVRPFFQSEGRAISDSGGDFHAIVYKCRATDNLEFSMEDGSFLLYGAGGQGLARQTGITGPPAVPAQVLYDIVQNETAAAIA